MNRIVVLGIAVFFAIVGIALMGGEKQAVAGHGCSSSCHGDYSCDGGGCHNDCHSSCHGRRHHRRSRHCGGHSSCHGRRHHRHHSCCAPAPCCEPVSCCGSHEHHEHHDEADAPPAPAAAKINLDRAPVAFRKVSFRR